MTETQPATVRDDITDFARRVRTQLDDLPADDVDELVDGLEADLMDQAADAGEDFALPDAEAYAAELRAAAGHAPRQPRRSGVVPALAPLWRAASQAWARIAAHRLVSPVIDWLVALRPVGWIARGWVVAALIGVWYGLLDGYHERVLWPLFAGLVVVSVQWGRGRWMPWRWIKRAVTGLTVLAWLFSPLAATLTRDYIEALGYQMLLNGGMTFASASTPGLAVDGDRVRNIFAYDAEGNPIEGVQLFDEQGNPLQTVGDDDGWSGVDDYFNCGGGPVPVSVAVPGREPVWNVYPLRELPAATACGSSPDSGAAVAPNFPFDSVPALTGAATADGEEAQGEPDSSPSSQPTASAEPSPDASPQPSSSPSPGASGSPTD